MRFEKTINVGHIAVMAGLLLNAAAAFSDTIRWRERVNAQMADTQRRIQALEATVAKLTENVYWLKENVAILTQVQKHLETEVNR